MSEEKEKETLHFDVSSGLKTVLGSDLITDDEVAIFELVKNSFDADATHVDLYFAADRIVISDNGSGMTLEDIEKKWMVVGFSEKRQQNRPKDFRDSIEARRRFAGSKGVGRFSADRLGRFLTLQTRGKTEVKGAVHRIEVDWHLFDKNHLKRFESIPVLRSGQKEGFELPDGVRRHPHGTVVTISGHRRAWDRDSLLTLKSGLAKLINPFGSKADGFSMAIIAPAERAADKALQKDDDNAGDAVLASQLVNGNVGNFIFETLQEKTTFLTVALAEDGKVVESKLVDRGELIYHIREPCRYPLLSQSGFRCEVYFLNMSAKQTFVRRMGVESFNFGSVFLFRNGFRVFPVGELNYDWFGMDRRKGQGYARYLGSRDVIGRIEVEGDEGDFREASSRNAGLVESPAVVELRKCFMEKCLKRLEKYVVPVTFADLEDKQSGDITRLLTPHGRARVTEVVARLVDDKQIELLEYSQRLIQLISERSEQFESSLMGMRTIAEKTQDRALFAKLEIAERRFKELRQAEERARQQADAERKAKEAAQSRAEKAEAAARAKNEELDEERKRNLFLASIATLDTETILNLHHQVTIYAVNIHQQIENLLVSLSEKKTAPVAEVVEAIEGIALLNSKILGVAKFATKANFRMKSERIRADLGEYLQQYIADVVRDHLSAPLRRVNVSSDERRLEMDFKPIDIAVVVDNLISNARKANATQVHFDISHPHAGSIHVSVTDNGDGFHKRITELSRVFEKGYTTTDGSGLGLYHVRQVLGEMKGTIEAEAVKPKGARFLIRISK